MTTVDGSSQLDPLRVDTEDHSSEGETEGLNFVSSTASFKAVDVQLHDDDDDDDCCFVTPSPVPVDEEVSQPSTAHVILTPEQQLVLDYVRAGKNVFFSGSGGTGKTLVLKEILRFFRRGFHEEHSDYLHLGYKCPCFACNVAVTAPTGIAALPIGGSTIHRAAGIGIPQRPRDFNRMWHKPVRRKWRNLSVLIVDEISMVSAEMLEYLEQIIRRVRTRKEHLPDTPFGGLQVIFAGDFFQLQPVEDKDLGICSDQFLNRGLAFEAPAWDRAKLKTVLLSRVFRQEDSHFVDLLNGIRTGENTAAFEEIVMRCRRSLRIKNGIKPTVLYSRNFDVDAYNTEKLNLLSGRSVRIIADEDTATKEGLKAVGDRNISLHEVQRNILMDADFWKDCIAPGEITLKVGAQVMLLRNLIMEGNEGDLVNGSRGILVGWKTRKDTLFECQECLKECTKIMRERTETDEERRKRIREEMKVYNLNGSSVEEIPIVRFRNGRVIVCVPEKFSYEILNVGECIRWQVPLKLAWALTIHKCQGMSLDYVQVTLDGIFAEGQVYVALSRARSMEGLQVIGTYNPRDVRVSQKVAEFYKALASKQVPNVSKFMFPDIVFEIPPEEEMSGRRRVDGMRTNAFEEVPPGLFTHTVTCFHCKKKGHPAFTCKLRPELKPLLGGGQ